MFPHLHVFRNCGKGVQILLIALLGVAAASGQLISTATADAAEIVGRGAVEVKRYRDEFRNLLATETKTFRIFDKNSVVKKKRVIVSNFLVYDLANGKGETTEFRNVLSVDGKPVANGEARAVQMFEKVSRAASTSRELERIQKESLRFDEEIRMHGLTLFQAIALNESIRGVISFELVGIVITNGAETYVLRYQQTQQSPYINAGGKAAGGGVLDYEFDTHGLRSLDPRISGTLWVDVRTFQIVREERKLWVGAKGLDQPLLLTSNEFEFEESAFGVRTPRRIHHIQYRVDKSRPGSKEIEIIYDYSAFTRPDVEVIPNKVKN